MTTQSLGVLRRLAAPATLVLTASLGAQQIDVALCAAAGSAAGCQWSNVQTTLVGTGRFNNVDIIDVSAAGTGTPTLEQLLQYDALLCWTNTTPADNNAWGDVLADYVDAGGGVVVAVFANSTTTAGRNIGGRWQNGYEVVLDQSGNASGANGTLGTVHVPTHPVMAGVTQFTGGSTGSRPSGTTLEVGATLIAEWNDGKVLVAEGANPRRVDLGFYPPSSACSGSGWALGGDLLMANALHAVSGGARFAPYGAGCAGSSGVPTLDSGGTRPTLGSTFSVVVGNVPNGVVAIVYGFSATAWGPFALPLELGPYGMAGCYLHADIQTAVSAGGGSTVTQMVLIPNDSNLLGRSVYTQAFVIDQPATPLGLTVSNAGRVRIGT